TIRAPTPGAIRRPAWSTTGFGTTARTRSMTSAALVTTGALRVRSWAFAARRTAKAHERTLSAPVVTSAAEGIERVRGVVPNPVVDQAGRRIAPGVGARIV